MFVLLCFDVDRRLQTHTRKSRTTTKLQKRKTEVETGARLVRVDRLDTDRPSGLSRRFPRIFEIVRAERLESDLPTNTPMMGQLLSINVGLPRDVAWRGEKVHTAIWKQPVQGRIAVRRLNVEGDGQGDLAGHGGEHRAVMVYQMEAYRYWEAHARTQRFFVWTVW